MLKTALAVGLAAGDDKQDDKGIQVENWDEKEPIQKSRKSKMAKSKKWICGEKAKVSRTKNFG